LEGADMMDLEALRDTLKGPVPPDGLSLAVCALWWEAKGEWAKAHECAQQQDDASGNWVHAYLHRREGDLANAGYWYRRAGKLPSAALLDEEWATIARALLEAALDRGGE
jgi:hypothetical protein